MAMQEKAEALMGRMLKNVRSSDEKPASSPAAAAGTITVTSSAFAPNTAIPRKYTQDDRGISPPLSWTGVPNGTRELLLVCEDPDAPIPQPCLHWIMYKIPPQAGGLPENVPQRADAGNPAGARQSRNYAGKEGYLGPRPPIGHGVHRYFFQLFALDQPLALSGSPDKNQLLKAMQGHVLAQGELIGTYERVA